MHATALLPHTSGQYAAPPQGPGGREKQTYCIEGLGPIRLVVDVCPQARIFSGQVSEAPLS